VLVPQSGLAQHCFLSIDQSVLAPGSPLVLARSANVEPIRVAQRHGAVGQAWLVDGRLISWL